MLWRYQFIKSYYNFCFIKKMGKNKDTKDKKDVIPTDVLINRIAQQSGGIGRRMQQLNPRSARGKAGNKAGGKMGPKKTKAQRKAEALARAKANKKKK